MNSVVYDIQYTDNSLYTFIFKAHRTAKYQDRNKTETCQPGAIKYDKKQKVIIHRIKLNPKTQNTG